MRLIIDVNEEGMIKFTDLSDEYAIGKDTRKLWRLIKTRIDQHERIRQMMGAELK